MTPTQKKRAKREAGEIIIDGINDYLDQSKSPVSGGRFKTMLADGTPSLLFEEGDMRSAIEAKDIDDDAIEVGIWDSDEIKKAYNHNIGDTLPERHFIADTDENFKRPIMSRVNKRIKEIRGNERTSDLRTVSSLLDAAFAEATLESDAGGAGFSVTIGNLLSVLDDDS